MWEELNFLREMNFVSMLLRLVLAMLFGGFIGLERERKRRPAGFRTYMLVCLGAALILAAEMFLSKLEYRMLDNAPEVNLYMEYSNKTCLDNVLRLFRDLNLKVLNMEITRSTETETHNACALFTLRLNKRCRVEQLIPKMNATEGVVSVEEL